MDDELSRRLCEAVKEANAAAEDAEWDALRNIPLPAPTSGAAANGSAAESRHPVSERAWDRSMVPDSKSIGWPGVRKPGFIDACEYVLSNLADLGHDALGMDQLADDMKTYESGIARGDDL